MLEVRTGVHSRMSPTREQLPTEERLAVQGLLAALDVFRDIKRNPSVALVCTFLEIAADEGKPQIEYAKKLSLPNSGGMTVNVQTLSFRGRGKTADGEDGPGLELIEQRGGTDYRSNALYLTAKGRALVHKMLRFWKMGGGSGE